MEAKLEGRSPEETKRLARLAGAVYVSLGVATAFGFYHAPLVRGDLSAIAHDLTKSDLRNPSPYNTRIHRGLPPTPIGNPGLASMQAAAHPAKVKYLYFVRKPDKVHHYSTASYADCLRYLKAHGYPTT